MKKIRFLVVILLLALLLCGCNSNKGIVFDPDTIELNPPPNSSSDTAYVMAKLNPHYSEMMKKIGTDGLIVAGYAFGNRKSFYDKVRYAHTETTFRVTDVYYGKCTDSVITVRERYILVQEKDYSYYRYFSQDRSILHNNEQVLLFLYVDNDGAYRPAYEYFPLMEDYKQYDDAFVESLCDFYRGDPSTLYNGTGEWSETSTDTILSTTGEEMEFTYKTIYSVTPWPEREISNEALLEELSDNLLVRVATKYEIALWPYGHKNFVPNGSPPRDLLRCCSYYPQGESWLAMHLYNEQRFGKESTEE